MAKSTDPNGRLNITGLYIKEYRHEHNLSLRDFSAFLQVHGLDWDYHIVHRTEAGLRVVSDIEVKLLSEILQIPIETLVK